MKTHHLRELLTITALSMEKASLGRPAIFQALILMGSPKVLLSEKSSEDGIFFDCIEKRTNNSCVHSQTVAMLELRAGTWQRAVHDLTQSCLNPAVKAPR